MEATKHDSAAVLAAAKNRIQISPIPEWATAFPYDASLKAKPGDPVTHLLIGRQINAERRQTCFHFALRLETMQAVQHESQWRLQFEPRTELVSLHWIRIRRGDVQFDHLDLEKMRLLQREEGLDGFVIDGWVTLLLLLGDVRPGDILDFCYTMERHAQLLPEHCFSLFTLPQGIGVGAFHFTVRFKEARPMKWKSSAADLKPVESLEDGEKLWAWNGRIENPPAPEVNTPESHLTYPWIQISDCLDWNIVAAAVAKSWPEGSEDSIAGIAQGLAAREADSLRQIESVIRFVQDEHRYLSVSLDPGGHVPTPPGEVTRRRYGDCKDLSFLLVQLLKHLGIEARPILVHTVFSGSIAEMLPMPGLFNHVVIEMRTQGHTRWIDATLRRQGGGPLTRFVPDYGVGLPVDGKATELLRAPRATPTSNTYELTESILLDTTGSASALAVVVRATGSHADLLRLRFEVDGVEKISQERLQLCSNRFANAKRTSPLQHRDSRIDNEFVMAEVFDINGFLAPHPQPSFCTFHLPDNLLLSTLRLPPKSDSARRTPFALPFPCHVVHTVEVESPSLQPMAAPRCNLDNRYLRFSRRERSLHKYWSMTLTLTTLADAVRPEHFAEHEKLAERIWNESLCRLFVPTSIARPRSSRSFGALPEPRPPAQPSSAPAQTAAPPTASNLRESPPISSQTASAATVPIPARPVVRREAVPTSREARPRARRKPRWGFWKWAGAIVVLLFLVFWAFVLLMHFTRP